MSYKNGLSEKKGCYELDRLLLTYGLVHSHLWSAISFSTPMWIPDKCFLCACHGPNSSPLAAATHPLSCTTQLTIPSEGLEFYIWPYWIGLHFFQTVFPICQDNFGFQSCPPAYSHRLQMPSICTISKSLIKNVDWYLSYGRLMLLFLNTLFWSDTSQTIVLMFCYFSVKCQYNK